MHASDYKALIRHMEWADALIWKTVLSLSSLEHDGWIRERLHHVHSTQWAYGQLLRGQPVEIPALNSFPDLRSIGLWARQFYVMESARFERLDETELQRKVDFPQTAEIVKRFGSAASPTVGESILQLIMHTTYHRGQLCRRLREAGGEPPSTDFISWIWMQRPPAAWVHFETT